MTCRNNIAHHRRRFHPCPSPAYRILAGGVAIAAVAAALQPPDVRAQAPEFRAMWISRFEWPRTGPAQCRALIDTMMQTLAANRFNAVFFQVRGQCDVLYPSPYEVWSPLIGGADPGWDPLAYAIQAAHANGIEFHAYINTHTCWQNASRIPPANSNHLFFAHCNASDPARRDWLIHDSAGNPVQWHENDYVWLAPGVPAYQAYTRKQVLYVVENYDVDGVHFDRIRTPNSSYSYDPISQTRRANPQSNPANLGFHPWTADQITRMVRDIYAAVMAVKPAVKVSAAVFSDPATAPANQHQDALAWAQTGGLDVIVPMMYFTGGAGSTWDARLQAWLAGAAGRHVVAGQITTEDAPALLDQIVLTRLRGAQGNSVFSWGSFTFWRDYTAGPYLVSVATPPMAWKVAPTTGIIHGYVTDASGAPVVDAQVVRSGSSYIGLSSGDGFYSLLLTPPGTYDISAQHPGYGSATTSGVAVTAGAVVRRDITLAAPTPPVIAPVTPDPDVVTAGTEYVRQLALAQGTADTWILVQAPAGATIAPSGLVHGWVPAAADAGHVFDFLVRASNVSGSDEASWRVQVEGVPPCSAFLLADFEPYADGEEVLFRNPRHSGTTANDLTYSPDVARVSTAVAGFSGGRTLLVQWQYLDTQPQRWMRLTTYNGRITPNPTVTLDRPIRVRMRVESGRFRLAMGIRETGATAAVGENGGVAGTIEWVGAETVVDGAPQGVPVDAIPGVWQTFVFDPRHDPVRAFTGDGILSTATNKGVFEHLAFSVVDSVGPLTVYIDDIEFLCPVRGDYDYDGDVDLTDFARFQDCFNGPNRPPALPSVCQSSDSDEDGDVDLMDFSAFQECFNGPNRPSGCP